MKIKLLIFVLGLFIGWLTIPVLRAANYIVYDNFSQMEDPPEFKSYKQALKVMISIMQDIKRASQETADNTKTIADDTKLIREKIAGK